MGIIERIMNSHFRPYRAKERTYAIFGKKLTKGDLIIYNNYIESLSNNLKTKLNFFYYSLILPIAITLIAIFTTEEYWSLMFILIGISMFISGYGFIISTYAYAEIGIYERAWIELLTSKNHAIYISFFQKIIGKTTSKTYPKVKSFLKSQNISLIITEDDIRSIASLSKSINKMKDEHIKFDKSILRSDEIIRSIDSPDSQ